MTVNVYPHNGPARMHVSVRPPTGLSLVSVMRLDRNGRTIWPAAHVSWITSAFAYDETCALVGDVEYVALYSDGTRESHTRALAGGYTRPRLLRLRWETRGGDTILTTDGNVWTEHDAVIDAAYDQQDITTVSRRGVHGVHATRNHDRLDTGRLVIWCNTHANAVNLRDDLLRSPLQYLRAPDQAGMDHALIVNGLGIRADEGAWLVDVAYTARPDLTVAPAEINAGNRTLGDHTGALADLAEDHHMLAELR